MKARAARPSASGSATTRARLATMLPGDTPAWPASRVRIGPARATTATVEPISTPAETAAAPPAIAVVATEAISHGASPTTITPSRSDPAATSRETAQESAGSTVMPTASAASSERQACARRRERGRVDRDRGGEDQDRQQHVDSLVAGQPGQRPLHGQAEDRRHEHSDELGVAGDDRFRTGRHCWHGDDLASSRPRPVTPGHLPGKGAS